MPTRRQFICAAAAVAVATRAPRTLAARYDLLVKGGRVIDRVAPARRGQGRRHRRRADCRGSPRHSGVRAAEVVDARGKIVTPGLVDIHAHLDAEMPPSHCLSTGVTAIVDAGSRGADNIGELVGVAESAPNRMRILLNLWPDGPRAAAASCSTSPMPMWPRRGGRSTRIAT